jgi:hypothetical protein
MARSLAGSGSASTAIHMEAFYQSNEIFNPVMLQRLHLDAVLLR